MVIEFEFVLFFGGRLREWKIVSTTTTTDKKELQGNSILFLPHHPSS